MTLLELLFMYSYRLGIPLYLCFFLCLAFGCRCQKLQYWGEKDRAEKDHLERSLERSYKQKESEIAKWQSRLQISWEQSRKLHENIGALMKETQLQGQLSRKIGQAYLQTGRYDLASYYYKEALANSWPASKDMRDRHSQSRFEASLSFFDQALLKQAPNPDLMYEAALAYANASRALGWEQQRFQIAYKLLRAMLGLRPEDTRAMYQLALLYAKTTLHRYRKPEKAIKLLRKALLLEEKNISARFALAHVLAQEGELEESAKEYGAIQELLVKLHGQGIIKGLLARHPNYIRARKNQEKLQACMRSEKECNF